MIWVRYKRSINLCTTNQIKYNCILYGGLLVFRFVSGRWQCIWQLNTCLSTLWLEGGNRSSFRRVVLFWNTWRAIKCSNLVVLHVRHSRLYPKRYINVSSCHTLGDHACHSSKQRISSFVTLSIGISKFKIKVRNSRRLFLYGIWRHTNKWHLPDYTASRFINFNFCSRCCEISNITQHFFLL